MACTGCATALTGFPNHVEDNLANIEGKVVSNSGGDVDFWIEYGPTTAYVAQTPPDTVNVPKNTPSPVTAVIPGLQRSTVYHYRFCARDDSQQGGPGCGQDRTFTTQSFACGDTVTANVRLTADVNCNDQPGLVVGADGIEIDLAGHTLDRGRTLQPNGPRGIYNPGFDNVTVRNGKLSNWGDAIVIERATANRVLDVTASGSSTAVSVSLGDHHEIRRSHLFGEHWGVLAASSANLVVAANEVSSTDDDGIAILNGDAARVVRNRVQRTGGPNPRAAGIYFTEGGDSGRIWDNVVTGPFSFGGIHADGGLLSILDNDVSGGKIPTPSAGESDGDGIFVSDALANSLLTGNSVHANAGDGIQIVPGGVRVGENAANSNGDWGIDAASGDLDLGGNDAFFNGNSAQCRNVFCP